MKEKYFFPRQVIAKFVLKIGTDGRLRKIAGNGAFAFSGDGGPAIDAALGGDIQNNNNSNTTYI